ncbi:MAG: O-antigen ligase family protein [Bacteroidota bacterium]
MTQALQFDLRKLSTPLMFILVAELTVGGGGRLIAWGPITLRMALFGCALLLTVVHLTKGESLPRALRQLLILFVGVIFTSAVIGVTADAPRAAVWEDVKPLLYFLLLPFFYFSIRNTTDVAQLAMLIRGNAVFLAVAFFVVLILIHSHLVPFLDFYHLVKPTEEFFFRGELTFVFKGMIYLSIGILFTYFTRRSWLLMTLVLAALLLTFTRGFWLALITTFAIYFLTVFRSTRKWKYAVLFAFCALSAGFILFKGQQMISGLSRWIDRQQIRASSSQANSDVMISTEELNPRLLGDRAHSDDSRWRQIKHVVREINLASIFVGHGFGNGTALRPVHMEISYLEIFHKQGVLGLLFWVYVVFLLYRKFRETDKGPFANAFFYSALFVFIQSATNQYFNNPIGMGMVLIALVSLHRLSKVHVN